ncbi:MAG: hypothetical protein WCJ30_04520, partial [Deltaproteobacteria bacterium]
GEADAIAAAGLVANGLAVGANGADIGLRCRGAQAIGPVTVNICSESPSATVDQILTLNSSCRSGQLGAAANDWRQSEACVAAGRVGGCQRLVQNIDVVTWVYSTDPSVSAAVVQQFCASISATYVAP